MLYTLHSPDAASQILELRGRCLQTLSRVLEAKDPAFRLSSFRAAKLAVAISRDMGIHDEHVRRIELGGMLHDIGKIGVPDSILHSGGKLSDYELEKSRRHPEIGVNILSPLLGTESIVLAIVMHHHERWDGDGYPGRLRENDIPIEARLVAVADAFIAMVSERPYRQAMKPVNALNLLEAGAGEQWDPDIVRALLRLPLGVAKNISREMPEA